MSDWQFASKQGNLKWTSPVIPDKGTLLFSALSPTLLLGYRVQGELFPVEYVKLADICRVSRSGEKGIELERGESTDGLGAPGSTILVVAESPSSADDWFSMINIAMQDNDAAAGVHGGPVMGQSGGSSASNINQPVGSINREQQQPASSPPPSSELPRPERNPNPQTAPSPAPQPPQGGTPTSGYDDRQLNFLGNNQQPASHSSLAPQQPQPTPGLSGSNEPCVNDPSGEHEFRPLSEVTHSQHQPAGPLGGSHHTATTTTQVVQEQTRTQPGQRAGSLGGGSMLRPLPSQSPIQTSGSMLGAAGQDSVWGPGANNSRMGRGVSNSAMTPGGGAISAQQSMTPGGRPRSGMMVSMPATQTVNRNIAPNMSAMWKEWDAPDGSTYLMFEPKGTMLRRQQGEAEFEPYVEGAEELTPEEFATHPYATGETTANLNNQSVRNLQSYGHGPEAAPPSQFNSSRSIQSPSVYRTEVVASPRGQYSPSRRVPVSAMASPREAQAGYMGRRVHRVQLGVSHDNPGASVIQHEVETLGSQGLTWNQDTNEVGFDAGNQNRSIGNGNPTAAVHKQWHEIRTILMRGRYFKKHAVKSSTSQNRMVFLTSDNSYVCAVPTSAVMQNASRDPGSLTNVAECVQYYGADTRAMSLNEILYVSMGTDEDFVYTKKHINPESTFCIISKKHAFVLECRNPEEAQFFCDSWTFFLFHSKPLNPARKRTPQMIAPVTHGTRSGIQF